MLGRVTTHPCQLAVGVLIHEATQATHVHAPDVWNGQQGINEVVEGAAGPSWGGACISSSIVLFLKAEIDCSL